MEGYWEKACMQQKNMKWAKAAAGEIPFGIQEKHLSHENSEALEEKPIKGEKSVSLGITKTSQSTDLNNQVRPWT